MAKPDWQNQNYKKANPVQKAAAGTLALGGMLAYGAKKAYDAFKNRKKDSDTSATTGIDISKDIKARNKPMVTPQQRKENQKAIQDIVDSQEVKFIEEPKKPKRKIKNPYRYDSKLNEEKKIKPVVKKKKNQDDSSNNKQVTKKSNAEDDSLKLKENKQEVKKNKTTTTKGKTRSDNRSRILRNDAASRTGKNSEQPKKKKPEMYSEYPRDVQARLKKIDKEIAKTLIVSATQAGSKRYTTLRAEKKDLLKNFKNKSIAENFGSP